MSGENPGDGGGETVSLTILGRPLTFVSSRVEACRKGIPKPGPCPDPRNLLPSRKGKKATKAVAKKVTPAKNTAPAPAATPAKQMTPPAPGSTAMPPMKQTDYSSMPELNRAFTSFRALQDDNSGWEFDPNELTVSIQRPGGAGDVALHPDGYHAHVRGNDGSEYRQMHPGPWGAVMDVTRRLSPDGDYRGSMPWFSEAYEAFKALEDDGSGWKFDQNAVKVTHQRPQGRGEVALKQDGYHARVQGNDGSESQRVYQSPAEAIGDVIRQLSRASA